MPDTTLRVVIHAAEGRGKVREFPVQRIESYTFEGSMDSDADAFNIAIGDPNNALATCVDRDTEVRVVIFNSDQHARLQPVFSGIADTVNLSSEDKVLQIQGRDQSSLALGDAPPGRWRHVQPANFIKGRATNVGMTINRIHRMAEIGTVYTDGSETEWAFWYRLVRDRGFFMWTEPLGGLVIDHLGYSLAPAYRFGSPPRGAKATGGWVMPDTVSIVSDKNRTRQVWVYAQDDKTGRVFIQRSVDTAIPSWRRKPIKIVASSTAKSNADAKKEADTEMFETIVGKQEYQLTLNDTGLIYRQNRMCQVNLPDLDIVGNFFIVGVTSQANENGKSQILRLRERGYAISKRVPTDPQIDKDTGTSAISSQVTSTIGQMQGVRWAESFVRASNEHGVKAGWDLAVFLGALLSICQIESGFANVREGSHFEWLSWIDYQKKYGVRSGQSGPGTRQDWEAAFANDPGNPLNPYRNRGNADAGVGPMQLTSHGYKVWADEYGWNGATKVGELEGGRWNPDSNIRAAARALVEKGNYPPKLDPTKANNIWEAVARYHGADAAGNAAYVANAKQAYKDNFQGVVAAAIQSASTKNQGTDRSYQIDGYGRLKLPDVTPDEVVKALNFCMNRRGDRYLWNGSGPLYDCSSLVTAAYASASARLRAELDEPRPGHHGENTYSLYPKGRFPSVVRDELLPGDLVFFSHGGTSPEHVGMFIDRGFFVNDRSAAHGLGVNALTEPYYAERYLGARRLVEWPVIHG